MSFDLKLGTSAKAMVVAVAVLVLLRNLVGPWFGQKILRRRTRRRPPGPFPIWPLLGSLPSVGKLPHRTYYYMSKKYGDVMQLKLGAVRVVVISSPEFAKEVLKTNDRVCASRPDDVSAHILVYGRKDVICAPYGDHWRAMRKVCALELLSPSRVAASQNIRTQEVSFFVNDIFKHSKEGKGALNMQSMLHETSMNEITRMLFKRSYCNKTHYTAEAQEFQEVALEMGKIAGVVNISDYVPCLKPFDVQGYVPIMKAVSARWDRFLSKIVADHLEELQGQQNNIMSSEHPSENKADAESKDFVDVMLSLRGTYNRSSRLENSTIKAVITDMICAGTDTSATTVEWALVELLRNPEAMEKSQEELDAVVGRERFVVESDLAALKYLQAVCKEAFRLHPPAPLIQHESIADCTVGGYHIPAKTRIVVNLWAVHRHPSAYDKPLEFNPSRFLKAEEVKEAAAGSACGDHIDLKGKDFQLIPFGSGRRMCPGMDLGLVMVQLKLARLVQSFTWQLPAGEKPEDLDMLENFSLATPKAIPLHVVATPRLPFHLYNPNPSPSSPSPSPSASSSSSH
ncbi:unnamed protein product [Sphagnum tenellum]